MTAATSMTADAPTAAATAAVSITADGLRALAAGVAGPGYPNTAPPLVDFVESEFNPLVYRAAWPCLAASRDRDGAGARTGLVLASHFGDSTTLDLASRQLVAGRVHNAILFMQATANAVLGYLSIEFGVTGPVLALSTPDVSGQLLDTARLWLADDELDQVVVIGVELTGTDRTKAAHRELGTSQSETDLAVALLVTRDAAADSESTDERPNDWRPIDRSIPPPPPGRGLDLLLRLAIAAQQPADDPDRAEPAVPAVPPRPAEPADRADDGADHRGAPQ